MNTIKLWNDNEYPFTQKFKGEDISIPPKSFIEMDFQEAKSFMGKYYPMAKNGMGQQDERSYKKLRIEGTPRFDAKVTAFKCHVDGSLHPSQDALEAYERQFNHISAEPEAVKKKGK